MTNTSKKNAIRIMAWILALLMIFSLATVAVSVLVEQCGETEEVPHDHNGDGVADHDDHEHTDGEIDDSDKVDSAEDNF